MLSVVECSCNRPSSASFSHTPPTACQFACRHQSTETRYD